MNPPPPVPARPLTYFPDAAANSDALKLLRGLAIVGIAFACSRILGNALQIYSETGRLQNLNIQITSYALTNVLSIATHVLLLVGAILCAAESPTKVARWLLFVYAAAGVISTTFSAIQMASNTLELSRTMSAGPNVNVALHIGSYSLLILGGLAFPALTLIVLNLQSIKARFR